MGLRVLSKLIDAVWGLSSLIPAALAVGGFMASRLHPSLYPEMQWLGLILPLVLAVNVVLLIYWMIRKKYWFVIPLLGILINLSYVPKAVQWPFKQDTPAERALHVATYNIQEFRVGDIAVTSLEIAYLMQDQKIDILCFQEFPSTKEKQEQLIEAFKLFPYYVIHASSPQDLHVALFSKYPIIQSREIIFQDKSNNTAMWADVDVEGNVVRVVNNHLQTTNLNQIGGTLRSVFQPARAMMAMEVLNENGVKRAAQADIIRSLVNASPNPLIVCGDFNAPPTSYTYRQIRGDLDDSFSVAGKGYEYTYRYLRKLLRIDYLFYSPETFKATRYYSPDLVYSDHKPVIVRLDIK